MLLTLWFLLALAAAPEPPRPEGAPRVLIREHLTPPIAIHSARRLP